MHFIFHNDAPIFIQVAQQIEQAILNGFYGEGEQIQSTTEIATTYQVNPATVLKGMNILVDNGILEKRRGTGVFVKIGALQRLKQQHQSDFFNHVIPKFIKDAKLLDISKKQLIDILESRYDL